MRVEGICLHEKSLHLYYSHRYGAYVKRTATNWTFQLGQSSKKRMQNFWGKDFGGGYWQIKMDKGMVSA
jgi:hypothetical protein